MLCCPVLVLITSFVRGHCNFHTHFKDWPGPLVCSAAEEVKDPSDRTGSGLCCEGYDPETNDKFIPLLSSPKVL